MEIKYNKKNRPLRVAIIGAECSGKSTLALNLSTLFFRNSLVKEYAREYLQKKAKNKASINYDTILKIAKKQYKNEVKLYKKTPVVIADTEILVNKVWCDLEYKKCHNWIEEQWLKNPYDLYLLNYPVEYEKDLVRFCKDPKERNAIFDYYYKLLKDNNRNFKLLKGGYKQRLFSSRKMILHTLKKEGFIDL